MRVCGTQSSTVHGYASVRYQIEKGLVLPDDIVEKYIKQFMAARRRHESLRTTFYRDEEGNPKQRIHKTLHNPLNILSYLDKEDGEREALKFAEQDRATGFDLEKGPLIRVTILQLNDSDNEKSFKAMEVQEFCKEFNISWEF